MSLKEETPTKESIAKIVYDLVGRSDIFEKTRSLDDLFFKKAERRVLLVSEEEGSQEYIYSGMAFKSKIGSKPIGLLFKVKGQKIIVEVKIIVGLFQVIHESIEGFQAGGSKSDVIEIQSALGVLQATIEAFGVTDESWIVR